jgi:hypothetical protein
VASLLCGLGTLVRRGFPDGRGIAGGFEADFRRTPNGALHRSREMFFARINFPARAPESGPHMCKPAVEVAKAPAPDVLAAFRKARGAGLPATECYRAGVAAWLRHYPRQTRSYAAERAVAIILAYRWADLMRRYRNEWDQSAASKDETRLNVGELRVSSGGKPVRNISRIHRRSSP